MTAKFRTNDHGKVNNTRREYVLDELDYKIVQCLQNDSSISGSELSKKLNNIIKEAAINQRIKNLLENVL
jgi:DNA-binding Lrp family transcriptional regulator